MSNEQDLQEYWKLSTGYNRVGLTNSFVRNNTKSQLERLVSKTKSGQIKTAILKTLSNPRG